MKYNPDLHHRRSIRLRNWDYAGTGAYFVTICCQNRINHFGKITATTVGVGFARPYCGDQCKLNLNDFGKIVDAEWQNLMFKYKNVKLGEYIVMPNHFHGIIEITGRVETGRVEKGEGRADPAPTGGDIADTGGDIAGGDITGGDITVGNIIAYFKYMTTKKINLPVKLWQRNYYEHIIRNEIEYANIEKYIRNNPIITYRRRIS